MDLQKKFMEDELFSLKNKTSFVTPLWCSSTYTYNAVSAALKANKSLFGEAGKSAGQVLM